MKCPPHGTLGSTSRPPLCPGTLLVRSPHGHSEPIWGTFLLVVLINNERREGLSGVEPRAENTIDAVKFVPGAFSFLFDVFDVSFQEERNVPRSRSSWIDSFFGAGVLFGSPGDVISNDFKAESRPFFRDSVANLLVVAASLGRDLDLEA